MSTSRSASPSTPSELPVLELLFLPWTLLTDPLLRIIPSSNPMIPVWVVEKKPEEARDPLYFTSVIRTPQPDSACPSSEGERPPSALTFRPARATPHASTTGTTLRTERRPPGI